MLRHPGAPLPHAGRVGLDDDLLFVRALPLRVVQAVEDRLALVVGHAGLLQGPFEARVEVGPFALALWAVQADLRLRVEEQTVDVGDLAEDGNLALHELPESVVELADLGMRLAEL